jgi:SAM-dependent methyltransferase
MQRAWDALAEDDAMWAALMDPVKSGGRWELEEFLATGREEIEIVLDHVRTVGIRPKLSGEALDFGCGIGRLTQALAEHFGSATGVDISPRMIALAQQVNGYPHRCTYALNESDNLAQFADGQFSFIYTSIVLQHMQARHSIGYLREFARVLEPGGCVVFQIPARRSLPELRIYVVYVLHAWIRPRAKARSILRRLGLRADDSALPRPEVGMHCLREAKVRRILAVEGLQVRDVQLTNSTELAFSGKLRYLDREPRRGFVSKQYCAVKPGGVPPPL